MSHYYSNNERENSGFEVTFNFDHLQLAENFTANDFETKAQYTD